ncbi:hypothetical protein [Kordiimonas sp.]|uniref:hypothetical protein n=1 Tax=Kordiimonas sp. TaxID=1970157 RepID=UPI003A8D5EFF
MTGLKKIFAAGVALAAGLALSNAASAATIYGELQADAGEYSPIALGESVALDGCGSSFDSNPNPSVQGTLTSLCNGVTDLAPFDFTWSVYEFDGVATYSFLGYVLEETVSPILTTGGASDLIQAAGTYFLSLNVTLSPSSSTFALPGGNTGAFQPNPGNLSPNSHSAFSNFALIVNPASVPEPAGALLLLPALVYMARRQRKQRSQGQVAS